MDKGTADSWSQRTAFVGFDWASDHHDVVLVDQHGKVVEEFRFDDTAEGWRLLIKRLSKHPDPAVAIETSSGVTVERLLEAGYAVYQPLRSRFCPPASDPIWPWIQAAEPLVAPVVELPAYPGALLVNPTAVVGSQVHAREVAPFSEQVHFAIRTLPWIEIDLHVLVQFTRLDLDSHRPAARRQAPCAVQQAPSGCATTGDFQTAAETFCGDPNGDGDPNDNLYDVWANYPGHPGGGAYHDLDWFFGEWVYNGGAPAYIYRQLLPAPPGHLWSRIEQHQLARISHR